MKLLLAFALVVFIQTGVADAAPRLLHSRWTRTMQGSVSEPSKDSLDHVWKFSLLGLAALSFMIRKQL